AERGRRLGELAVDAGAVRRAEILDVPAVAEPGEPAVLARDAAVGGAVARAVRRRHAADRQPFIRYADPLRPSVVLPHDQLRRHVHMLPRGAGSCKRSGALLLVALPPDRAPLLLDADAAVVQLEAAGLAEVLLLRGVDEITADLFAAFEAQPG